MSSSRPEWPTPASPASTLDEGAAAPATERTAGSFARGTCLGGRYVIEAPLGAGGMGSVYAAHDRVADHPVALKFIHAHLAADAGARRRLRAELKTALAVTHANVARTHTLEELDGHTFLVMERLDGPTLADHLRGGRLSEPEALRLARGILAGVAAAHERGVVHRDLKPLNIKICVGARPVVMDFGLAVLHEHPERSGAGTRGASAWGGTPGYMAPEVEAGAIGDARADVYALGVVLFELFAGKSPLAISETLEAARSETSAPLEWPARRGELPGWIVPLLRELLDADPAKRPVGATAVLERLDSLRGEPQRRLRAVLVIALALATIAVAAGLWSGRAPRVSCGGDEARLAGAWDAPRRARVEAAFVGTGRAYARDTMARVGTRLDGATAAWAAMRRQACEATHVRHEQSEALLDLRMACLNEWRGELEALVRLFGERPDVDVLDRAVQAAASLSDVNACADVASLQRRAPPPPPMQAAAVTSLRARLQQVIAMVAAGKLREALPLADALVHDADALGYVPLRRDALTERGRLRAQLSDQKGAEADLLTALALRGEADDVSGVASLQNDYADVLQGDSMRAREALTVARLAGSLAARTRDEGQIARADLIVSGALMHIGDYPAALEAAQRGLAAYERLYGPESPRLVVALIRMTESTQDLTRLPQAIEYGERALTLAERAYGPDHPRVAKVLDTLTNVYSLRGKLRRARELWERGLVLRERIYGPESPEVGKHLVRYQFGFSGDTDLAERIIARAATILAKHLPPEHELHLKVMDQLAGILGLQERFAEAEAIERRVLERSLAIHGAHHPFTGLVYRSLAEFVREQGRRGEEVELYRRAMEAHAAEGKRSMSYAQALQGAGDALHSLGRCAEAVVPLAEALAIFSETHGSTSMWLLPVLFPLGECELRLGRVEAAVVHLEQGVRVGEQARGWHDATGREWLARALWAQGKDRPRALAEAAKADAELVERLKTDPGARRSLRELRKWRAAHRL